MKKVKVIVGCMMLLAYAVVSTPVYAANPVGKLVRGVANVATAWVEVPKQVKDEIKESNPIVGVTVGLARGLGMMVARTLVGVYEVATFPVPVPDSYEPMIEPGNVIFN